MRRKKKAQGSERSLKITLTKRSRIWQYQVLVMMMWNNRNSYTSRGNNCFGKNCFLFSSKGKYMDILSSVQSLSRVRLFATPWTAAHQAFLSITNSWSSPKLTSIESVMPSSHLILCHHFLPFSSCPQSLPASESFPMSQPFAWGGQSTGVSALASFLPKKSQGWSPWEWTGWISLQSKGLSRVFSNTTVQKHQFFSTQLSSQSNSHIHTWPLEKP